MSTEKAKTSGVEKDIKLSTKIRYDDDGEEIKADQNFSNDVSSEDGGVQLPQVSGFFFFILVGPVMFYQCKGHVWRLCLPTPGKRWTWEI